MTALEDLQTEARDLIAAADYWSGSTVLVDDGKQVSAEADALRTGGHVGRVLLPLVGDLESMGAGDDVVRVRLGIRIAINTSLAWKNILILLKTAKAALLDYEPANPDDRYTLADQVFELDDSDPGELAMLLTVEKLCTI